MTSPAAADADTAAITQQVAIIAVTRTRLMNFIVLDFIKFPPSKSYFMNISKLPMIRIIYIITIICQINFPYWNYRFVILTILKVIFYAFLPSDFNTPKFSVLEISG